MEIICDSSIYSNDHALTVRKCRSAGVWKMIHPRLRKLGSVKTSRHLSARPEMRHCRLALQEMKVEAQRSGAERLKRLAVDEVSIRRSGQDEVGKQNSGPLSSACGTILLRFGNCSLNAMNLSTRLMPR